MLLRKIKKAVQAVHTVISVNKYKDNPLTNKLKGLNITRLLQIYNILSFLLKNEEV